MAKLHRNFILPLLAIIAISGCVESTSSTTAITPTVDPTSAYNTLVQAQKFYQTAQSDLSKASSLVNDAASKGVETTSSSSLLTSPQLKLSNAANVLTDAINAYNAQDYPLANSYAEQSISLLQEVQNQVDKINSALEADYMSTVAKYKPQLIEAERQYRIAQKYMEAAQRAGANVSIQHNKLNEIVNTLNSAKKAFRNNNFVGLTRQIDSVRSSSQQLQAELTDLYYDSLIVDATKKIESQLVSEEAKTYLSEANSLRRQRRFQEAVVSLNKALVTETQLNVVANVNKLKQSIKSWGLETSFGSVDAKVNSMRSRVAAGDFDGAKQDMDSIKNEVAALAENSAQVADAKQVIDDTAKLSFMWATKPDTSAASAKWKESRQLLAQGRHAEAAVVAKEATNIAINERQAFWSKVKNDWLLGFFLRVGKVFRDPEKYEIKAVERPQFEWKPWPELVRIEFGRPIVDVENIVVEDPGAPVVPSFMLSTPPPKRPVYLILDPGNPTECGLTCRETIATIINRGDETATNVKVYLEVYNSRRERLNINGKPQETRDIGTLKGGESKSERVRLKVDCGFLWSKCWDQTVIVKVWITSDQGEFNIPEIRCTPTDCQ